MIKKSSGATRGGSSVDISKLCPVCGKNLELVGKSHHCEPVGAHRPENLAEIRQDAAKIVKPIADKFAERLKKARKAVDSVSPPSHPDCEKCKFNREQARQRMQKKRKKIHA